MLNFLNVYSVFFRDFVARVVESREDVQCTVLPYLFPLENMKALCRDGKLRELEMRGKILCVGFLTKFLNP